jgi:hypothetical protein
LVGRKESGKEEKHGNCGMNILAFGNNNWVTHIL